MSGIFGFSVTDNRKEEDCICALERWNRFYGREGYDSVVFSAAGLGCYVEHLTKKIPLHASVFCTEGGNAIFDALLYNREEIGEKLCLTDVCCFSDEELLLRLVTEEGIESLAAVNGDFSGAMYDLKSKRWILFRDHMGVRPLFYYLDESTFAFSTDMRGLTAFPGTDLCLNEERFYQYMMGYNDLSLTETEFANIHCVPPASCMIVTQTRNGFSVDTKYYWKLGTKKIRYFSNSTYQAELRKLISDSVQRRLKAVDGLVGAELSGGLDSSVIAILINRTGREGRYYSWSYDVNDIPLQLIDERKVIFDICEQEHISCQFSHLPKGDELESVDQLMKKMEVPYINTTSIGEGSAMLRSQGVRAMFTGHGGDEGVSHRCDLYELWYHKEYISFFRAIYRQTCGKKLRMLRTAKRAAVQISKVNLHYRGVYRSTRNIETLLNPAFCERMEPVISKPPLYFAYDSVAYIMQGGSRPRMDNVAVQGAENGVRYFLPFLDYRVIDFAVSIPRTQYQNGRGNRWIYRQAFGNIMPKSLREVHYKDTPSQRNFCWMDERTRSRMLDAKEQLLQHLDRRFWENYLNFDAIDALNLKEECSEDDCLQLSEQLYFLTICAKIENLIKYSAENSSEKKKK